MPGARTSSRSSGSAARSRRARLAVDVLLADQRLRADRAGRVGVERREIAGRRSLIVTAALLAGELAGRPASCRRRATGCSRRARRRSGRPRPGTANAASSKIARTSYDGRRRRARSYVATTATTPASSSGQQIVASRLMGPAGSMTCLQPGTGCGRRAVRRRLHGATRAACLDDLQPLSELRMAARRLQLVHASSRTRRSTAACARSGRWRRSRRRAWPRFAQRGDDVGRVLAQVVELRLGVVHLLDQPRERGRRQVRQRRGLPAAARSDRPVPVGLWISASRLPIVGIEADVSLRSAAANSREPARRRDRPRHERVERVERRCAGRRTSRSVRLSVGASSASACSSAWLWLAIAPVVALVFDDQLRQLRCCGTRAAGAPGRPARAGCRTPARREASSAVTSLVLASPGARYWSVSVAPAAPCLGCSPPRRG